MTKLNEKEWRKFPAFGENGFLHIQTTSSSIDAINLINGKDKIIPYITRSDSNNGLSRFVSDENYVFGSDESGCITVGLDTQTAFYQPHKFVTGQNVQIITGNVIDDDTAHFLASILREQMDAKFNWGGNGATLTRMKRLDVLLPVDELGSPDFNYMGDYVRNHRNMVLDNYRAYVERQLKKLKYRDLPSLDKKEWKPFSIIDIFECFDSGKSKGLNHLNKQENGVSYIGATNRNNGVLCFVAKDDNSKKMIQDGNCVGFIKNGDGSAGFAIYKSTAFISTSDVIYGYANWLNKFTGLFFVTAQDLIESKYSHGYKRNEQHLAGDKVMLPADTNGYPDYEYMEQYSKNLMYVKYKQYLDYLDKKSV